MAKNEEILVKKKRKETKAKAKQICDDIKWRERESEGAGSVNKL